MVNEETAKIQEIPLRDDVQVWSFMDDDVIVASAHWNLRHYVCPKLALSSLVAGTEILRNEGSNDAAVVKDIRYLSLGLGEKLTLSGLYTRVSSSLAPPMPL